MNLRIISTVISREYLTRVKKKSFLLLTFLAPVLFAALCILPSLIMLATKEKVQRIAVVDRSGIVLPYLTDSETARYTDYSAFDADSVKAGLDDLGMDGMLVISPLDSATRSVSVQAYSRKPLGMEFYGGVERRINQAVEDWRVSTYRIEGLSEILNEVKSDVKVAQFTLDESGGETRTDSSIYMVISLVLGMVIFMFITMFGSMVMQSVIEEKSSRVVEVLISSVQATDLMFGKIIGVALVALTQFFLWIVLTVIIVGAVFGLLGPETLSGATEMAAMDPSAAALAASAGSGDAAVIVSTLAHLPVGRLLVCFLVYFVLGYLLYASFFAAIGSAVENEADTQQLQIPVTIPLMLGFFIAFYAASKNPDGGIAFWGSMIPFTSPIVMLARIPYGVALWEILLSVALLLLTFVGSAWVSAKIYKVGILMFGKKSTFKDLWNWLKQK
jgi:ABC-2 type transport system permease protein